MKKNKPNLDEFLPYLEELRKRLFSILILFFITTVIGIIFSSKIIVFFLKIFNFSGVNIVMTSPSQLVDLAIYTGIICGILAISPILVYQLICFVKPAFNQREYKTVKKFLPISVGLFLLGMFFGAWVTQFVIIIFSNFSASFNVNNIWDIQSFFFQVIVTALLSGIIFQMPLVLTALMRFGLLTRGYLIRKRKYVYGLIVIFAVLLPPTDILTLVFITLPLLFLFEIALLLNRSY